MIDSIINVLGLGFGILGIILCLVHLFFTIIDLFKPPRKRRYPYGFKSKEQAKIEELEARVSELEKQRSKT